VGASAKRLAPEEARLKVEYLEIGQLVPYATNARTHSVEQLAQIAASIRRIRINRHRRRKNIQELSRRRNLTRLLRRHPDPLAELYWPAGCT
jgi:hypothetical protein